MIESCQPIELADAWLDMNRARARTLLMASSGERLESLNAAIERRAVDFVYWWGQLKEVSTELLRLRNAVACKGWVRHYSCGRGDIGVVVAGRRVDVPIRAVLSDEC